MKPKSIQISENLMFVLDDGGHGRDCHILQTFEAAKEQLLRWRGTYSFDPVEALVALVEFFKREPVSKELADQLERVAKDLLEIPTLATRNSDALDFHEVAVWEVKLALRAAYEAGRLSVR